MKKPNIKKNDKIIDDYFNKGIEVDKDKLYHAIVENVAFLEYTIEEQSNKIDRLMYKIEMVKEILKETK